MKKEVIHRNTDDPLVSKKRTLMSGIIKVLESDSQLKEEHHFYGFELQTFFLHTNK